MLCVFSVAKHLALVHLQREDAGPCVTRGGSILRRLGNGQAAEPGGNGPIVCAGVGIDLRGQRQARAIAGRPRRVHFGKHARVIRGVDHHRHPASLGAVIFCGCAQHGGATDVDVFDRVGERAVGLRNGFTKRVQVDDEQIDAIDAVLGHRLQVLGAVAPPEQATVNFRVQRLDAPIQDFG